MNKWSNAFKIRNSVGISILLHGFLFGLALWQIPSSQVLLPVGVDLKYGEERSATTVTAQASQPPAVAQRPPTVVPHVDESDIPSQKPEDLKSAAPATSEMAAVPDSGRQDGSSAQGALSGQEGVRNGIEVSAEDRYLYELQKLLERKQRYPLMAKKMRQTGTVRVRITLQADGSLTSSEVIEKSQYETLNVAAKSLVQEISGLKPFPQEIRKTSWVIEVPIEYVLN